jgi:PAP2 superfamily
MELGALDRAVYQAVATTPTAQLDRPLRRLSRSADAGALWLVIAAGLAATRRAPGRRVASEAVTSLAVTAITVNLGAKSIFRRRRPDRARHDRTPARRVPTPSSSSFPSGHSATSFAFATRSGATSRSSASRSGSSPLRSPTRACTSACTTPATSSSARSWAPEPPLLSAPHGIIGAHSHPAQRPPAYGHRWILLAPAQRTEREHRITVVAALPCAPIGISIASGRCDRCPTLEGASTRSLSEGRVECALEVDLQAKVDEVARELDAPGDHGGDRIGDWFTETVQR